MRSNPTEKFIKLPDSNKNVCFLHSANQGKSILAYNPTTKYSGENLKEFQEFLKKNKNNLVIGYLAYDLAYQLYDIKKTAKNDLKLPEIYFLAFKKWEIFNNHKNHSIKSRNIKKYKSTGFKPTITKTAYNCAFKKIKNYIKEGDVYQLNLTHRLEASTDIPAKELFIRIIQNNPVDYLAYIGGDKFEILSASPERFVKIENGNIETCPIKGTRPRGKNKKTDQKLKNELLKSEKEAAELNMITDLLRNDLGKICKIGTVKVKGHRLIQKCPTVWHTYSKITGKIDTTPIQALISMLPGGSITGCPKKRAIEIIDELEPNTRGLYTGVIGYIEPNKNLPTSQAGFCFNIAIRTIIKKGKKLYLQVGGGIVNDSIQKSEYQETLDKAKSFMKILN